MTPWDSTHQDDDHWRFLVWSLGVLYSPRGTMRTVDTKWSWAIDKETFRPSQPTKTSDQQCHSSDTPTVKNSVTTQTARLPATSDVATDPPPAPPARTYAEAATQATATKQEQSRYQPPASPGKLFCRRARKGKESRGWNGAPTDIEQGKGGVSGCVSLANWKKGSQRH